MVVHHFDLFEIQDFARLLFVIFKIFLDVNSQEATQRIFAASKEGLRSDEKPYTCVEEVTQAIAKRLASDQKRYKQYYVVDYLEKKNYDLVIDTTDKTPEEIVDLILKACKSLLKIFSYTKQEKQG